MNVSTTQFFYYVNLIQKEIQTMSASLSAQLSTAIQTLEADNTAMKASLDAIMAALAGISVGSMITVDQMNALNAAIGVTSANTTEAAAIEAPLVPAPVEPEPTPVEPTDPAAPAA